MNTLPRYCAETLSDFATRLLEAAGMQADLSQAVAATLVEGDLLGHDTHGLALLAPYVTEIQNGTLSCSGTYDVLEDQGATLLWDGKRLPGPWLVREGLRQIMPRARQFGIASLAIRNSHHIACLAAYLQAPSEQGFLTLLTSSDPTVEIVAPHGGTRAVFTPNPIAAGIPAQPTPFLIDISASITTNGMVNRLYNAGQQFAEPWLLDADGQPSTDPATIKKADPPGTILPLGGLDAGHKGFALAILIEALTSGLTGQGRASEQPTQGRGWGASVNLTLFDTRRFAGQASFLQEMSHLADTCRSNPPRPGVQAVRMPGDRGLQRRAEQLAHGVQLHPGIVPALIECAQKYQIRFPEPRNSA